jgi:CDP-4-dehydro-6-deoxyglucose reductase
VVQLRGGQGSGYLFEEGKPGLALQLKGPLGRFVLPEKIERDILFVCTGTGVAPFRSMLQHIRRQAIPHQKLWLVFGTRTQSDLLYFDEFRRLEGELEGFRYIPTLSREQWPGRTGYVHLVYEEICATRPDADFYLCGWRMMIDEAKRRIAAMGYDRTHIHQELYG